MKHLALMVSMDNRKCMFKQRDELMLLEFAGDMKIEPATLFEIFQAIRKQLTNVLEKQGNTLTDRELAESYHPALQTPKLDVS